MNNNNNNNYYFLFFKDNIINFLHVNKQEIEITSSIKGQNIILIVLEAKIQKKYIYSLLREFHIIKLYYLSELLASLEFNYLLINLKYLYISCKKDFNRIFINIYVSNYEEFSKISLYINKNLNVDDLLNLINSSYKNYYKYLDFHEKLYIILNRFLYEFTLINLFILVINIFVYLLTANK